MRNCVLKGHNIENHCCSIIFLLCALRVSEAGSFFHISDMVFPYFWIYPAMDVSDTLQCEYVRYVSVYMA